MRDNAERSWGGPGRRFITNGLLKAYHEFLRNGAYALVDSEALDDGDVSLPPPLVISRPRAAVVRDLVRSLLRQFLR